MKRLPRLLIAVLSALSLAAGLVVGTPRGAVAEEVRSPSSGASVTSVPVLHWPVSPSAASYELQVSSNSGFVAPFVSERRATPHYAFSEDVAPGTYYWRYRSFAGDGTLLSVSPAWTFVRQAQPGPEILGPDDKAVLDYPTMTPTFRWSGIEAFGSYVVQWDDNRDFNSPTEAVTSATAFTSSELLPQKDTSTEYWWRVKAASTTLSKVETTWSQTRSIVVRWGAAPAAQTRPPHSLSLDVSVDQVVYEWDPVPGAASYELQVALDQRFATLVHPDTGIDYPSPTVPAPFIVHGTTFVAPSVYPAKSMWWRVRALDALGAPGPWQESPAHFTRRWTQLEGPDKVVAARPDNVTVAPAVPINEFEVTWDEVANTTYYEVEISTEPAFHDGKQRAICRTPHPYFAPAFEGGYKAAGRENYCPIRLPESALPSMTNSAYEGDGTTLTIWGSGPSPGTFVLLYFGPGDPDNGKYKVDEVFADNPDTPNDESAFTVAVDRLGAGDVMWRSEPPLLLTVGQTYYVRVRAVHETTAGDLVYSMWSDEANDVDQTPPGPAQTTLAQASPGDPGLTQPAQLTDPAKGITSTDWPMLRWKPVNGADAYLVAISKDREFTDSILVDLGRPGDLGTHFEYYVTSGTSFVPQTTLAENDAGDSYYWYVLPCSYYATPDDNTCAAPDRSAILQSGRWRSFHKSTNPPTDLAVAPEPGQPWVTLSWADTTQTNPWPTTEGSGGFSRFEVQITDTTWAKATTLTTETPLITTSELKLEPSSSYRWRVRAIDGGLLPLSWSDPGPEIELNQYAGPAGLTATESGSVQPCLRWNPEPHASSYVVEIYRGTSPAYPASARVQEATTAYAVHCPTGLSADTYTWRVRSVHALSGKSLWTPGSAPFAVQAPTPNLVPSPDTSTGSLLFDWEPVNGAAAYLVEISTDEFWTVAGSVRTVADLWSPAVLPAGTYQWRVSVVDKEGNVLSTSPATETLVRDRTIISEVKPRSGPARGGTAVTISGVGFESDSVVEFGGTSASVVERSPNSIKIVSPSHPAGTVDVTVRNTTGSEYTLPNAFTYTNSPAIVTVSPGSGPTAGGTHITVTGQFLHENATVTLDGKPASVVSRVGTTAVIVATPAHPAGLVTLAVTNPDGEQATAGFTYVAPPVVTGLWPPTGPTAGGAKLTLTGTGFDPGATVRIDGMPAEVLARQGSTGLMVSTPAHSAGPVDIVVTNPDGQQVTQGGYRYVAAPRITSVTPDSGPTSGYTRITVTGTGFDPSARVLLDGTDLSVVQRQGTTELTVLSPAHAAGPVSIRVINPDDQEGVLNKAFTFIDDGRAATDAVSPPTFVAKPRLRLAGRTLKVKWSRPTSLGSPVDTYRVLATSSTGSSFQQVHVTSRRRAAFRVAAGRTYWVRIVAHSAAGWGQPSPIARRAVR